MAKKTATATIAPGPRKRSAARATGEPVGAERGSALLGPGLHGGTIELATDRSYRVRMTDGTRRVAKLAAGVDRALADECLRDGRMMVLADGRGGPVILGALQTSRGVTIEPDGTALLRARSLRLHAEHSFTIEAGTTSLRLDASGAVRTRGDRLVVDMASNVRFVSALVELP